MNISKYLPFGIRLLQIMRFCKRIPRTPQISRRFNSSSVMGIQMFATLAFLWPVKSSSNPQPKPKEVLKVESIVKDADYLFENAHYEQCHQLLSSEEIDDVEIKWRIARVLYNMSKELKVDDAIKKELILKAYEIIFKQLEKYADNFAVQKWYALLLDAKSAYGGIKERIKQLENVKKHMDLAVTLNPSDATTLHMLGEWCYQVAELPWHQRKIAETFFASPPKSSYEDAMEYFLRAESVDPRFYSINLLRLGSCYLKLKKDDQAKYYLKLAASYPAKSNDDHQANKEAAELLKKFK